jgi:hypothetical protein
MPFAGPPPSPPAIVQPAEPRTIIVWGDAAALEALRKGMEGRGWAWMTGILGGKTPALFLTAPESVQSPEILRLINDINGGRFGKLNAGYGIIGKPADDGRKPDNV